MRTPNPRPLRRTINATLEATELVERESYPGEPRWRALDRLLSELLALRERELRIALARRIFTEIGERLPKARARA